MCIPYAPKTMAELCGTYILDCELAHEELTLHSDGTFVQTATIKATSEVLSSKGKWAYDTDTSHSLSGNVMFYSNVNEGFIALFERPDGYDLTIGNRQVALCLLSIGSANSFWGGLIRGLNGKR